MSIKTYQRFIKSYICLLPLYVILSATTILAQNSSSLTYKQSLKNCAPFIIKKKPKKGDWLSENEEKGQTLLQFIESDPPELSPKKSIIYLKPMGNIEEDSIFSIEIIKEFLEIYYGIEVRVLSTASKTMLAFFPTREHQGNKQLKTENILRYLMHNMPDSCFSIMALTPIDIYPDENHNYVFGIASLKNRVGITSLARFDDSFYTKDSNDTNRELIRHRALKLIAHETGHMFGMDHCIFYECLMNGVSHQMESDSQPMTLCPICLKKLRYSVKIDPKLRYAQLYKFYTKHTMKREAAIIEKVIKYFSTFDSTSNG